jgi:hypothetical protein
MFFYGNERNRSLQAFLSEAVFRTDLAAGTDRTLSPSNLSGVAA